jgi:hypothetical protein
VFFRTTELRGLGEREGVDGAEARTRCGMGPGSKLLEQRRR